VLRRRRRLPLPRQPSARTARMQLKLSGRQLGARRPRHRGLLRPGWMVCLRECRGLWPLPSCRLGRPATLCPQLWWRLGRALRGLRILVMGGHRSHANPWVGCRSMGRPPREGKGVLLSRCRCVHEASHSARVCLDLCCRSVRDETNAVFPNEGSNL
jgi:hypothetical protein